MNEIRPTPQWMLNAELFWRRRRSIARIVTAGVFFSVLLAFVLPKRYESSVTLMPPEQTGGSAALLAALSQRGGASTGALGMLAGTLFGAATRGEMFIDLLRSGSVGGALARQFELQRVYHKRYMSDTLKKLGQRTSIAENKKSGLITLTVEDSDPGRARDLANAYIAELNRLLTRVSTSSARRERISVEQRLKTVQDELQKAQVDLSDFSSHNTTIDLTEQTKATVDAGAKIDAQLIASKAQLASLRQIYGEENPRVIAARQETGVLEHELSLMSGNSTANPGDTALYPSLRKLPSLGVQWANLYRKVKVQETVFELLSAQYEAARIQEAREVGTVSVVDSAGVPEKKSFPKRTLTVLIGATISILVAMFWQLAKEKWQLRNPDDPLRSTLARLRLDYRAHGVFGGGGQT